MYNNEIPALVFFSPCQVLFFLTEIRCGTPSTNGSVIVKLTGGDAFQAMASYSCPSSQCLNGDKIRHCQADGKWSGIQPSCLSEYEIHHLL